MLLLLKNHWFFPRGIGLAGRIDTQSSHFFTCRSNTLVVTSCSSGFQNCDRLQSFLLQAETTFCSLRARRFLRAAAKCKSLTSPKQPSRQFVLVGRSKLLATCKIYTLRKQSFRHFVLFGLQKQLVLELD